MITASVSAHPGIGIVMDSHGNVFYTDLEQVWKISPEGRKSIAWMGGLWLDAEDNVYVAVYGGHLNVVKKVSLDGKITVAAHSNAPWGPTGGLVAPNGDLWLLEYSTNNTARVRQIWRDGSEKIY